uniref:CSON014959 protein n=1 Tax=Culicoides sonorensis TaxID=179676 RepID=A0A336MDC4_CULSO
MVKSFTNTLIFMQKFSTGYLSLSLLLYLSIFDVFQVRNFAFGNKTCLDSPGGKKNFRRAVSLYPCHGTGGNQFWMFSKNGEIRRDEACLDYAGQDVILYP